MGDIADDCPLITQQTPQATACPIDHVAQSHSEKPVQRKWPQPEDDDFDPSCLQPIPKPPAKAYLGLLGHAPDLEPTLPVKSYWKLMDEYSPIYQLDLNMPLPRVFVGSRELVNEMADDSRFVKFTHRLHQEMRAVFGDGLFSAESTSLAWWKAHRLLVPAFGPVGLSKMFEDMQDISAQLIQKWDRYGHETEIECIEDMARLTFDTIGLCAFGYRFNEFYMKEPHPFMQQLWESIVESGKRANRPDLVNLAYYKDEARRQENIVKMRELCRKIIQDRLEHPKPDSKDLLNVMLHGVDKESGETLGVENVIYQIPTLLGGGYETTGSTLCFIYYYLCKNPQTMRRARQEVDDVVGNQVLTYDMLCRLKYLDAVMKEALRMQHPVSLFTRFAIKDTVIGGKYLIKEGQMLSGIWRHFHRDPKVWGEDADEFKPERMLDENFSKMPPNAFKPFGDGLRACIGRGFAEQEILIHIAMALQKFDISLVDPDHELRLKGQMGVKPVDFKIRVKRRADRGLYDGIPGGVQQQNPQSSTTSTGRTSQESNDENLKPVTILYGGNMGTCESLVDAFARKCPSLGLRVVARKELDDVVDNLPTDSPCLIIVPSYEGRPPDNAKKFVAWIEKLSSTHASLPATFKFAVFGVGNSDWVHTFHKIPKLVDEKLGQLGAERILPVDFANVKRDLYGAWEDWSDRVCTAIAGETASHKDPSEAIGVDIEIEGGDSTRLQKLPESLGGEKLGTGTITVNRELAAKTVHGFAKRHVEIRLPKGCQYRSGDYVVIQPQNPEDTIRAVIARFNLDPASVMRIKSSTKDFLPQEPMAVQHFLQANVELSAPVTPRQLSTLLSWCRTPEDRQTLQTMQATYEQLVDQRYSILDVLHDLPTLDLPFGVFVDLLPPLAPRLYSIASSPLDPSNHDGNDTQIASITFDVFSDIAKSGHGTFQGVASTYLATRAPGDQISCHVRPSRVHFQLPHDPSTPIIMLAAGSGIAPFRAFLQERAVLAKRGAQLGPALLFYGCRNPEQDYLYADELQAWCRLGIVHVVPCFSRPSTGQERRYVGDALWERRERAWSLFEQGAQVYVCGSAARLGQSVADVWMRVWMEVSGKGLEEAREWLFGVKAPGGQYVSDVY
ncbi:hypothetical protein PRZ48_008236 [Zasmidium cellare]|uniref:Bifunctional cytochrome P450/NADPH--P450 reductase n=1 Tax=Zasmidium cellare TaxID=395010 RepID=A0ABR0EFI5_ZASCE|nr:hypothetical protein PRZ48_008236 [Zasmidium cellare]